MDILQMIAELRAEKAVIEESLMLLERLARAQGKRRGRPPLYLAQSIPRKRRPFSEETKRKMAASQRKRWAAYRKEKETE